MIEQKIQMHSKTYQLFLDSMVMDFDKWHDGIGYDLEKLELLEPDELATIEQLLINKLKQDGDWRDLEALNALETPSSDQAVDQARFHNNSKLQNYALRIILDKLDSKDMTETLKTELEDQVVQAVLLGDYEMAERMPTLRVKKALLESTRNTNSETRVSAAAFLLYLCGQAPEPFDWSQRPFFLQFAQKDPKMLHFAWEHLRKRTGL